MDFGETSVADGLRHGVAVLEHRAELHIAQAAHGGVADIGGERAARIGVFEEVGDGIADEHLIPDADAHRRAFLAVHGLAAQVGLVEPQVEDVAFAEPVDDRAGEAEFRPEEVDARLVEHGEHLAKEHVDVRGAFLDDGVDAKGPRDAEAGSGTRMNSPRKVTPKAMTKFIEFDGVEVGSPPASRMTWRASLKSFSRTLRR